MRVLAALWAVLWLAMAGMAAGQGLSALARLDPAGSRLRDAGGGIALDLALSQPVPWRVRVLDAPPRLVADFREVDWGALDRTPFGTSQRVRDLRAGPLAPGWSRLVLELDGPYRVAEAEMRTGADAAGGALVRLRLDPTDPADFAARAALPDPEHWALPLPRPAETAEPRRRHRGEGPLTVALDPGHGGIDPGAERGGKTEAALMLTFARELKEALVRAGGFSVVMTREADVFVPLETRIAIAHEQGADVFLSLHGDAAAEGEATGATVYVLADAASDAASAALAERHDRDSLLAGVDLKGQDDVIAGVLMDMARRETAPRSDRLSAALVAAIAAEGLGLHSKPRRGAAFSVLKSPDIPSVLIELGYMSSPRDLDRLSDPAWRARMAGAIAAALRDWSVADAAEAALLRQ